MSALIRKLKLLMDSVLAEYIHVGCNPNLPPAQIAALKKTRETSGHQVVFENCAE